MKRTIRLTESELRNIISEVINELDPRTYASARDKQAQRNAEYRQQKQDYDKLNPIKKAFTKEPEAPKNMGRATEFNKAAISSYNKQIGKGDYEMDSSNRLHGAQKQIGDNYYYTTIDFKKHDNPVTRQTKDGRSSYGTQTTTTVNPKTGKSYDTNSGLTWDDVNNNRKLRIGQEMSSGGGRYMSGHGWMEENINEAISRAIRKVLN